MSLARTFAVLLASTALVASVTSDAPAAEHYGVSLKDTAKMAGKAVQLNGAGRPSVLFIGVYVIGFWTEKHVKTTDAALSGRAWKVQLRMLRGPEPEKIRDGIQDGFNKNSPAEPSSLQARLDTV